MKKMLFLFTALCFILSACIPNIFQPSRPALLPSQNRYTGDCGSTGGADPPVPADVHLSRQAARRGNHRNQRPNANSNTALPSPTSTGTQTHLLTLTAITVGHGNFHGWNSALHCNVAYPLPMAEHPQEQPIISTMVQCRPIFPTGRLR